MRYLTLHAWLILALALPSWAVAATLPPEAAIELDLRWLSPPQVSPQTGAATAEMHQKFTRLSSRFVPEGASFTWPIRYAIPVRQYPIVVLRYSARNLFAAPGERSTLLQMNLAHENGTNTPAIIVEMQEIVQDGVVHEIRKDLSRVGGDSAIDSITFSFNAISEGGRIDIYELRFEPGPGGVAPFALPREQVQFLVKDASGNVIPDAQVRAGLTERGNWTSIGNTDGNGQVTMQIVRPMRPDGSMEDPVEAMVLKDGFVPQYVAPIEFPRGGPVEVTLTSATAAAQAQSSTAVPIGQEPDRTVYVPSESTIIYETGPTVVYVDRYAPYWWVPRTYVGYHPYFHYYYGHGYLNFRYHDHRDHPDLHDRDRRRDVDRRTPPPSPPPAPPVVSSPRDRTREVIRNEVARGNEPAAGIKDSAIYRRAERDLRGDNPPARTDDRGDRYRRTDTDVSRGNEPARPSPPPPAAQAPRQSAPAPAPSRQVERVSPAPGAGAPSGDRGDRYRRAEPRSAAPPVVSPPSGTAARQAREMPAAARVNPPNVTRSRPSPPVVIAPRERSAPSVSIPARLEPTLPARINNSQPRRIEPTLPSRIQSTMPPRIEPTLPSRVGNGRDLSNEIRRGNEPPIGGGREFRGGARFESVSPARSMSAPRSPAPSPSRSAPSGDRGSRYSR